MPDGRRAAAVTNAKQELRNCATPRGRNNEEEEIYHGEGGGSAEYLGSNHQQGRRR